jgi:hypothetical protein
MRQQHPVVTLAAAGWGSGRLAGPSRRNSRFG